MGWREGDCLDTKMLLRHEEKKIEQILGVVVDYMKRN